MNTATLKVIDGNLYIPFHCISDKLQREWANGEDRLLLVNYGEDCDSIQWPNPNRKNLACALYDAREMGLLPANGYDACVFLPDGELFNIDSDSAIGA